MYNLIVSGHPAAWDEPYFSLEEDRFLEYTEDSIIEQFRSLDEKTIAAVSQVPTVFAYERSDLTARVGWITAVRVRGKLIRIKFGFDEAIAPFTTAEIKKHLWEFDAGAQEMNRTHWAIKDIDLFESLAEAGLGGTIQRDPNRPLPPYAIAVAAVAALPEPRAIPLSVSPAIFRVPEGGVEANLVAIMMPFDAPFDGVHEAIRSAVREAGLVARRVDDMWEDTAVIQDVFSLIYRANIVVVDFTGRNPNVFYETGIAHTLGKHVVPITQVPDDVPFDLRQHRFLPYLPNTQGLQELVLKLAPRLITLAAR